MATFEKRKNGWRAQVYKDGVRASKVLPSKTEAKAWAAAKEFEISNGGALKASERCVSDLLEKYRDEVSVNKRGERWERVRIGLILRSSLAKVKLDVLNTGHLALWRDARLKEVQPSSVNRELNLLSAAFSRAIKEWGWLKVNPVTGLQRPKNPPHRDRRISADEITLILSGLGYNDEILTKQHLLAVMFLFALETAMRLQEICNLRKEQVFDTHAVVLRSKNGDKRNVPLSREAKRLAELMVNSGLTLSSESASTLFRRVVSKQGIADLTFHDSRHEAMTRLAEKIDVLDLAKMVGHRDIRNLMIYYNPTMDELSDRLG